MKHSFILLAALALAVAVGLISLLLRRAPDAHQGGGESAGHETTAATHGRDVRPAAPQEDTDTRLPLEIQRAVDEQNRAAYEIIGAEHGMTPEQVRAKILEWYLAEAARAVPEQSLLNFFGKVVDESMRPVPEATIRFLWIDATSVSGTSEAATVSSDTGEFSLTNASGHTLSVLVFKEGHDEVKSRNQRHFNTGGYGSRFDDPVIFHLRKRGEGTRLITSRYGVQPDVWVGAPRDGSPLALDFFTREVGGRGQLFVSNVKPDDGRLGSRWSLTLSVPGGGLVEHADEFPFEAPEAGYQPVLQFVYDRNGTHWSQHFRSDFYVMFGEPRKYGRVRVETSIFMTGARIEYAVNPTGERTLR